MALFFTADTHFGDHRTINIHRRPFADVAEMDAAIVTGWNQVVRPEDEVWHLGDVARRSADVASLLARLNGVKHLVRGNNDGPGTDCAAGRACRTMPSLPVWHPAGALPLSVQKLERAASPLDQPARP